MFTDKSVLIPDECSGVCSMKINIGDVDKHLAMPDKWNVTYILTMYDFAKQLGNGYIINIYYSDVTKQKSGLFISHKKTFGDNIDLYIFKDPCLDKIMDYKSFIRDYEKHVVQEKNAYGTYEYRRCKHTPDFFHVSFTCDFVI